MGKYNDTRKEINLGGKGKTFRFLDVEENPLDQRPARAYRQRDKMGKPSLFRMNLCPYVVF